MNSNKFQQVGTWIQTQWGCGVHYSWKCIFQLVRYAFCGKLRGSSKLLEHHFFLIYGAWGGKFLSSDGIKLHLYPRIVGKRWCSRGFHHLVLSEKGKYLESLEDCLWIHFASKNKAVTIWKSQFWYMPIKKTFPLKRCWTCSFWDG